MFQQFIIAIIIIIWLFSFRWKNRNLSKQVIKGKKAWPLVGHAYLCIGNEEDRMKAIKQVGREAIRQGGIIAGWSFPRIQIVVVADPVVAEFVLKTCHEKHDVTKLLKVALGNGSVIAPVALWHPRRKILVSNFTFKKLNQFVSIFSKHSDILADQLRLAAASSGPFSLWNFLTAYTFDSVCETTLGVQLHAQKNADIPFLKASEDFATLMASRMCQPWLHSDTLYRLLPAYRKLKTATKVMFNFVDQVIKLKKKEVRLMKNTKEHHHQDINQDFKTFLELLIEASESSGGVRGYSDLELREETMVIVLAATESSAVGVAFTTVMLSKHQDVQEKVYDELKVVFGDSTRPITTKDLSQLKYLDAVVKETMRLYPPVPVIARKATDDVILPTGVLAPKGWGVGIHIWAIHRNPRYWGEDAELFRPKRFLDSPLQHPAQFMPFGYGPRNCPAHKYAMMSMKTALATLLRHYRVLPAGPGADSGHACSAPDKDKPLRVKFNVMMKHVDNFVVQLESRDK